MKVLIITPSFSLLGGVANHYLGLQDFWTEKVRYEVYGKRKHVPAIVMLPLDFLKYFFKLLFQRPKVVIINPSLRNYQLKRDGAYLLLARTLGIPVVTFFHGWDRELAKKLKSKPGLFKKIYNKSRLIYVLAEEFKSDLIDIGISKPISLTTTKVDDKLVEGFDVSCRTGKISELLFLGRVIEQKGIFIALNAFEILHKTHSNLRLRIVGDGPDLEKARQLVNQKGLLNVNFQGPVFGRQIAEEFENAQIYILPSFEEGMPTSVLEAMAFGLPVVSRPVGGLNDFFNDKMGRLIPSFEAQDFADAVNSFLENEQQTRETALYNAQYAKTHFMASRVAKNIELELKTILE